MSRKNKAARAVNVALGLIVILAVILASPLFGYGRGFSTPEQREAAAAAEAETGGYSILPAAATPRPTPKPTPTPVILPSAPPTPEPTPVPVRTPAPQVQQYAPPAQQAWAPQPAPQEEYTEEEEYVEEENPQSAAGQMQWNDTGGEITENESGGQYIGNDNFDLIFSDQSGTSTAQTVYDQPTVEQQSVEQQSGDAGIQQDNVEGEAYFIQ